MFKRLGMELDEPLLFLVVFIYYVFMVAKLL